ncbi:MAG: hypothetical protein ACRCVN_03600 [Spirochaetia bacterium]
MKYRRFSFLIYLIFLSQLSLFAQQKPVIIDKIVINTAVPQSGMKFFYGNTKPWVLRETLYLDEGQIFENQAEFNKKIEDIKEYLGRLSTINEEFVVTVSPNPEANQSQATHIILTIDIQDSFNFIAYPRVSFSSSDGTDIGVRFRHYNPFGFMSQWTGRVGFSLNEENRWGVDFSLQGAVPFYWFKQKWDVTFGIFALIAPWYGSIDDTLQEEVPFNLRLGLRTFWQLYPKFHEAFGIYTEIYQGVDVISQQSRVSRDYDPYILYTGYTLYLNIPIYEVEGWGTFTSLTGHGGQVTYRLDTQATDARRGYSPVFSHSFSIGDIDLVGNMRRGLRLDANAYFKANPYRARHWGIWGESATFGKDEHAWRDSSISATARGYYPVHEYVTLTGRMGWTYYPFDTAKKHDMGGVLRGIRDSRMVGDMLFFWNLDVMFKAWIGKLDFIGEVWLSLFYDGGMTRQPHGRFDRPFHAIGAEIVYYPKFSRNVRLRVSLGEDVEAMFDNGKLTGDTKRDGQGQYELYLGIDLHY